MPGFYRDFAAAYGTCWLVLMTLAVVGRQHIDAGEFGFYGFLILSLLYAFIRGPQRREEAELRERARRL